MSRSKPRARPPLSAGRCARPRRARREGARRGRGRPGTSSPALALARRLVDREGADVRFAGTESGLEARLVANAGFPFLREAERFVRKLAESAGRTGHPAQFGGGCRPMVAEADLVVGMGGYVSGPVVAAAFREPTPVVLHEQNAVPGAANRLFSRRAERTALSFADAVARLPEAGPHRGHGQPRP